MLILASSSEYISIPVTGPVADLTPFTVSVALIPEATGGEPVLGDYKSATWINGKAAHLITAGDYPAGEYLAFVRIQATPEDVRLYSGRVRIGDARI